MDALEGIQNFADGFRPLNWWLMGAVIASQGAGLLTGYFRARKIQPKGVKWSLLAHELVWTVIDISTATFTGGYTTIWDRLCRTLRKNFAIDFKTITTHPMQGFALRRQAQEPAT